MMDVPKITLDTNCLINLLDLEAKSPTSVSVLNEIFRRALSTKIDIAITTRVETDLRRDRDSDRKAAMLRRLEAFPVVGTIARWDVTIWDKGDMWSSDATAKLSKELQQILFPGLQAMDKRYPNKLSDIDHLVGHIMNRRDIFVTDDKDILKRRDALKSSPGLVVVSPDECLRHLEKLDEQSRPKQPPPVINEAYRNRALKGRATFDYSNENGRYLIGEGLFLVETKWSKASNVSIHAYVNHPQGEALALVKDKSEIEMINDASTYDYSSRVRTPQTGQVLLWRNPNGIFAATKILKVKDDTRGDANDEVTFDYVILADGSSNFGA